MDSSWLPQSEFQSLKDQIRHVIEKVVRVVGNLNTRVTTLEQALDLQAFPLAQPQGNESLEPGGNGQSGSRIG